MGLDFNQQSFGTLPGGLRIEAGEYTVSDPTGCEVPTGLTKLLGGICCGELTDHACGYASGLNTNGTIEFVMSDATLGTMHYIAFGY